MLQATQALGTLNAPSFLGVPRALAAMKGSGIVIPPGDLARQSLYDLKMQVFGILVVWFRPIYGTMTYAVVYGVNVRKAMIVLKQFEH